MKKSLTFSGLAGFTESASPAIGARRAEIAFKEGKVSRTALTRILHNSIRRYDLNDLLAQMAEGGTLEFQEVKTQTIGRPTIYYQLRK